MTFQGQEKQKTRKNEEKNNLKINDHGKQIRINKM